MINKTLFARFIVYSMIALVYSVVTETRTIAQTLSNSPTTTTQENPTVIEKVDKLVIDLSDRKVYLYRDDRVIGNYAIAVGKKGWETPTGNFAIREMIRDPAWQNPFQGNVIPAGQENPLGDRWIGFWTDGNNSIGFHGTPNEESVGKAASHGCIRMYNRDVRVLFDQVAIGTPVIVQP
jgi:lipoprotein-anchoring transpeptidase ErfK/SrfK